MIQPLDRLLETFSLPPAAKAARRKDRDGVALDPGIETVVKEGIGWLARAQDNSASADGGVARSFSLITGWATSYPETTGYIVPTMLQYARRTGDLTARERAVRMLDWLVRIQLPDGGFQGGRMDSTPVVPVTFNTGQILLGLAAGGELSPAYRTAMRKAADWLVAAQDADGCWRKHPTPFARPGEKAYETHVAWGLIEAARVDKDRGYAQAALRNVSWAMTKQTSNGWMRDCCLTDAERPLTHTLGYALRGLLEAQIFAPDAELWRAVQRMARGLMTALEPDGRLPGRLDRDWRAAATWTCLTGSVQIAYCWLLLYEMTDDRSYLDAAQSANAFVRRTIDVAGAPEVRGGVKGSFPVDGDYGRFEYLNWAAKFCIDSQLKELDLLAKTKARL
jgi:hypothetical protein